MKKIYIIGTLATLMLLCKSLYSQVTFSGNSYPGGTNYVGWDNSNSVPLDIKNLSVSPSQPIDFYINSTKYLQLKTSGDLNVVNSVNGLKINDNYVLWHNDDISSIFVGVAAGTATVTNSTLYNTLVGNKAGTAISSSSENTLMGYEAGKAITTSDPNVAIGFQALHAAEYGWNTAVGYQALLPMQVFLPPTALIVLFRWKEHLHRLNGSTIRKSCSKPCA